MMSSKQTSCIYAHFTIWQVEGRCQRSKDASLGLQTAYFTVCVYQKERLWGVGHSWGRWFFTFLFFLFLWRVFAQFKILQDNKDEIIIMEGSGLEKRKMLWPSCCVCRGWLIQASRFLSRCSGSSPKKRWTRSQLPRKREQKSRRASPISSNCQDLRSLNWLVCFLSHVSRQVDVSGKLEGFFTEGCLLSFSLRSTRAMSMIPETLTMPGWKLLLSTFTMT